MMRQPWLEKLKKIQLAPAILERRSVTRARKMFRPSSPHSVSPEQTIWVDISVLCRHDAGSGIQRVVRALLLELQAVAIPGWCVQPVAATPRQPYRAVPWEMPTVDMEKCPKMEPLTGDIFLGLDLSAHIIPRHQRQMAAWKMCGLKLVFVIYDLLPLHYPNWFSAKLVRAFRRWIESVAILADSVFCISRLVKDDFESLMFTRFSVSQGTISAHLFPMGADMKARQSSMGLPPGFGETLRVLGQGEAALMVGTIEPRKGCGQILDAFEQPWSRGRNHRLVIVGRPGWLTHDLQQRIMGNPRLNQQLFWFGNASDEALEALYQACAGVVVAPYAEGYGLPLLEAVGHGKPVLAKDIAAFRQFETPLLSHFPAASNTDSIGQIIDCWLGALIEPGRVKLGAYATGLPTWCASLQSLLRQLLPQVAMIDARYSETA